MVLSGIVRGERRHRLPHEGGRVPVLDEVVQSELPTYLPT